MKRAGFFRMGTLGMGSFLIALLIGLIFGNVYAHLVNHNETDELESKNCRGSDDYFYVYNQKVIGESKSLEWTFIINSTGELIINNSAKIEIFQKYDFHRNITVKDNGTLRLQNGSLVSNKALLIILKNNGKLILEDDSNLEIDMITANDKSTIQITSSDIYPGTTTLEITMNDESSLNLVDSAINNAENVDAKDKTSILIKNSEIKSEKFGIFCKEITFTSNQNLKDIKIDRCEYCYILGSNVENLKIESCGFLRISQRSKLINSLIKDINELDVDRAIINNVEINEIDSSLIIKNSDNISGVFIRNCTTLEIHNSKIKNFNLEHFSYSIEIHDSLIEDCSILPKNIVISDSMIEGSQNQLNILTKANNLIAYNTSFSKSLNFVGTSDVHLVNCSIPGDPPLLVKDDAKVYVYWWLEVVVTDSQDNPLADAIISIHDFRTNEKITEDITNQKGKVLFKLLANIKTINGWDTKAGNSYFIKSKYDKNKKENGEGFWIEGNKISKIKFEDVNKGTKKSNQAMGTDTIIGIFIFVIVIILIGLSIGGKSRKNEKSTYFKETKSGGSKNRGDYSSKRGNKTYLSARGKR